MSELSCVFERIGPIQRAAIALPGLTVLAGENDTGKSTLGKALFCAVKADNMARVQYQRQVRNNQIGLSTLDSVRVQKMNSMIHLVFENQISELGGLRIHMQEGVYFDIRIASERCTAFGGPQAGDERIFRDATFIQTPFVWDLVDFFDSILRIKQGEELVDNLSLEIKYPYLLWDVYSKIATQTGEPPPTLGFLLPTIRKIIKGEFVQGKGKVMFRRGEEDYVLSNVASGIKYFGIFQRLYTANKLQPGNLLILDEPENHIHPAWQIQLADIIVRLVAEHGLTVLVQSHSPYMLEGLKTSADKYIPQQSRFYWHHYSGGKVFVDDVSSDLSPVFSSLTEPFYALEHAQMEQVDDVKR
jgi:hypothetical protein